MNLKLALQGALAAPEKKKREGSSVLPWLAAAGAGAAAYKFMRTPSFSSNRALAKIQRAAQEGFHRVVEVKKPGEEHGFLQPVVDEKGGLSPLNKLKLFLSEGTTEAIPYTEEGAHKTRLVGGQQRVNVKGVVADRTDAMSGARQRVFGGLDIEGSRAVQSAATRMGVAGKGVEADILQKYAPGAMPETKTDLGEMFKDLPGDRYKAMAKLQSRVMKAHGKGMLLKPVHGAGSHGAFPDADKHDWAKTLREYDQHMASPENRKAYLAERRKGLNDEVDYLYDRGLHEGHVLHSALRDPSSVMAQRKIKKITGEFRVHTVAGTAPSALVDTRWLSGESVFGGAGSEDARKFVEDTMKKLPAKRRLGSYGIDVMSHEKPDGSIGHQIIEMNPTERTTATTMGGRSGFLDTSTSPLIGHAHYRVATGRHAPLVAGVGALGLAGVTGLGARAMMGDGARKKDKAEPA